MKTIVGFGASSMEGVGDPAGGFFARLSAHPLLADLPLDFKNHGKGGNSLWDMLQRASEVAPLKPYDLIVILGCNDLPRIPDTSPQKRSSLADYKSMVRELLRLIQGERSLFITSFAVSQEKTGVDPRQLEAYLAEALAAAVDLGYETWDLHQESKAKVTQLWAADGLHFNGNGHQWIADHVARWIQEV